jgi:phage terminase large subunit
LSDIQIPKAFAFLWSDKADDGGPVRHRASKGGRGSAKSHSFAKALCIKAAERPLRIGCFREVQKSIRDSVKRLLDDKISELYEEHPGLRGFFSSTDTEIRTATGGLFVFGGLRTNPDAVKSLEGLDIAWVEEASRASRRSIELLIPTVRKPGSELWWTWNPENATDPVDEMFCGAAGPPPGSILRQVNYTENPFFPEVLKRELEYDRRRDPDKFQHVWLGGYRQNSEARVFKNWIVEEFDSPTSATFRLGADWGFSVDPTVLVRCFIGRWENGVAIPDDRGRHLFIDYEAYEVGCEIVKTPALFDTVPDSRAWPITADSARPETISHMRTNGFPKIVGAIKGARSVEEGVEWLKSYDIIVHPRCVHAIADLSTYSFETDPLTGSVTNKLADKANNVIDALRYACEGATRAARVLNRERPVVAVPAMRTAFNRARGSR